MSFPTCPPRTSIPAHAWPGAVAAPPPRVLSPQAVRLRRARGLVEELLELDASDAAGDEFWREWARSWLGDSERPSDADTDARYHEACGIAHGLHLAHVLDDDPRIALARARIAVIGAARFAERDPRGDAVRYAEWLKLERIASKRIEFARDAVATAAAPRRIP